MIAQTLREVGEFCPQNTIGMNHSVRTIQYTKSLNAKHTVKAEISVKTISVNDSAKRSHIPPAFVYDFIGNMAGSNKP